MIYTYVRYSHRNQRDKVTEDLQASGCQKYIDLHTTEGLKLHGAEQHPEYFADRAVSAWTVRFTDRVAGGDLDGMMVEGDHLIVYCLDRAFRNVADGAQMMAEWVKRGITVHFVLDMIDASTDSGWLALHIKLLFAEYESRIKSTRITNGIARRKENGEYRGGNARPFYRWSSNHPNKH